LDEEGHHKFSGTGSIDCVSCYSTFKVDATIKYSVEVGTRWIFWPYAELKFMAELTVRAVANIDLNLKVSAAYDYEPPAKKIASITPMINEALGSFNIIGIPFMLGATFGIDVSVGVKFSVKANLEVAVGADTVCTYKFGIYHNYDRPDPRDNGCQFKYHPAVFSATGVIEVFSQVSATRSSNLIPPCR
jgi:hypothetical protein